MRLTLVPWKILYFREGVFQGDPKRPIEWNRGAYLVNAVVHCGECHTPRNTLGALIKGRRFAGVVDGPDGLNAPDITPHPDALGPWSTEDIETLLKDGLTPDGAFVGRGMRDVVADTAALTETDRHAIAVYLKALPPQPPPPKPKPAGKLAELSRLHLRREDVAAAAHGLDQARLVRIVVELAPQPADLDIDRAIERSPPPGCAPGRAAGPGSAPGWRC